MGMQAVSGCDSLYSNFIDLHHDSSGIICISQIESGQWNNHYGRYKAMYDYMSQLESQEEIFFSQNTFKKFRRSTENLLELKAVYIDLDYYKSTKYTREQILGSINLLVEDGMIPHPTHIIDSGYGINVIWRIKRTPAKALPLWRTVEQYLFEQFELYGADRKALDVTRVFRPADSYNAKNEPKKKVNVIYSSPIEYDIHLFKEYIQFPKPVENSKTKTSNTNQSRTVVRLFNKFSLYYNRYMDILAICYLRNFDVKGHREQILFLYRYYGCAYLADDEQALENALALNGKFVEPLKETEVRRATRSAERAAKKLKYGYRSQTLVELLEITEDEMMAQNEKGEYYLKTIISKDEKYRRNNKRRYDSLRNKKGKTKEEERQDKLLKKILRLRESGKSQKETAKELGITIRTVQKYEAKLREEK